MRIFIGIFLLLANALLSGCNSSGSDSNSSLSTGTQISGRAMLGPVYQSTVSVFPVAANGTVDFSKSLGSGKSDINGNFTFELESIPSGPIAIQIQGGVFSEEASGASVLHSFSSGTFTTILPNLTSTSVAVGPLTEIAYQRYLANLSTALSQGRTVEQTIEDSNYSVSKAFGLSDIVRILPADPYSTIPNDESGKYILVLAGISKAASDLGVDSVALTRAYATDFKTDGSINPVSISVENREGTLVTFTPPSLPSLQSTVSNIAGGTVTLPGVSAPPGLTTPSMNPSPPVQVPPGYIPLPPPPIVSPPTVPTLPPGIARQARVTLIVNELSLPVGAEFASLRVSVSASDFAPIAFQVSQQGSPVLLYIKEGPARQLVIRTSYLLNGTESYFEKTVLINVAGDTTIAVSLNHSSP